MAELPVAAEAEVAKPCPRCGWARYVGMDGQAHLVREEAPVVGTPRACKGCAKWKEKARRKWNARHR